MLPVAAGALRTKATTMNETTKAAPAPEAYIPKGIGRLYTTPKTQAPAPVDHAASNKETTPLATLVIFLSLDAPLSRIHFQCAEFEVRLVKLIGKSPAELRYDMHRSSDVRQ
jgi:hypothetical protein